jgi:hypothetical protein
VEVHSTPEKVCSTSIRASSVISAEIERSDRPFDGDSKT